MFATRDRSVKVVKEHVFCVIPATTLATLSNRTNSLRNASKLATILTRKGETPVVVKVMRIGI